MCGENAGTIFAEGLEVLEVSAIHGPVDVKHEIQRIDAILAIGDPDHRAAFAQGEGVVSAAQFHRPDDLTTVVDNLNAIAGEQRATSIRPWLMIVLTAPLGVPIPNAEPVAEVFWIIPVAALVMV